MKKGEQTRAKMIEAAGELLRVQGYAATGVKEILARSGAPRGSFYFHFPDGKQQLACAALSESGSAWRTRLQQVVDEAADLRGAVTEVCRVLAEELEASDFRYGCPVATVALEAAAGDDAVRQVCAEHFEQWQETIAARLGDAGADAASAATLATLMLAAVEGALMLCRAQRSTEPLRRVAQGLEAIVGKLDS